MLSDTDQQEDFNNMIEEIVTASNELQRFKAKYSVNGEQILAGKRPPCLLIMFDLKHSSGYKNHVL